MYGIHLCGLNEILSGSFWKAVFDVSTVRALDHISLPHTAHFGSLEAESDCLLLVSFEAVVSIALRLTFGLFLQNIPEDFGSEVYGYAQHCHSLPRHDNGMTITVSAFTTLYNVTCSVQDFRMFWEDSSLGGLTFWIPGVKQCWLCGTLDPITRAAVTHGKDCGMVREQGQQKGEASPFLAELLRLEEQAKQQGLGRWSRLIGTVKIHRCKVNQIFASGQLDNETVHKRNYRTSSLASKPYNARPFFTYLELTRPHNPFQW
ncbi:hypothetical protein TEA_022539 [Camellia sinensis var. sinensis]|uniref:Uncharacterized protein n=1 Tax=Camellia sinensis var. sinensis TaxID=542762 RepID=A0A4S4D4G4_CAMSN|nr:hypothetical protein TEA_022539 [Camellia sinensis var. sinensis]